MKTMSVQDVYKRQPEMVNLQKEQKPDRGISNHLNLL